MKPSHPLWNKRQSNPSERNRWMYWIYCEECLWSPQEKEENKYYWIKELKKCPNCGFPLIYSFYRISGWTG